MNTDLLTQSPTVLPASLPVSDFELLVSAAAEAVQTCRASRRKAAMDYVLAGAALAAVKNELVMSRSESAANAINTRWDNNTTGQVVLSNEKGWQALCQERIGISYKTADRYIEDACAYELLRDDAQRLPRAREYLDAVEAGSIRAAAALAAMEQFKALPEKGEPDIDPRRWAGLEARLKTQAERVRFREMEMAALSGDELAANELEQCAKGNIPMARAYAGWQGGIATRDKARKDPDYARLMIRSSTTLLNSWSRYYEMETERRRAASDALVAVMTATDLPEEIGREIFSRLSERFGQGAKR
jgi:hypothetical protein